MLVILWVVYQPSAINALDVVLASPVRRFERGLPTELSLGMMRSILVRGITCLWGCLFIVTLFVGSGTIELSGDNFQRS